MSAPNHSEQLRQLKLEVISDSSRRAYLGTIASFILFLKNYDPAATDDPDAYVCPLTQVYLCINSGNP